MSVASPDLSSLGQAALRLARLGLRVFPCHTPRDGGCSCGDPKCDDVGKHPRTVRGLKDATTDPARVFSWWLEWPDANIGVRTGEGLLIVDIDGDEGRATWAKLCAEWGLPPIETARVLTGKGDHLYLRTSEVLSNTVRALGPGVDTRAVGGYAIAPPSLHVSGRQYVWDQGSGPELIADAPPALIAAASKPRPEASEPAPGGTTFVKGGRNKALFSIACSMRRKGLDVGSILAALLGLNASACKPPLDEVEVRRIVQSSGKYPPGGASSARPSNDATPDHPDEQGGGRASKAGRLLELLAAPPLVQSPTGRVFAEIDGGAVPLDGAAWASWGAAQYQARYGGVVSGGLIKDCTRVLLGRAQRVAPVPLRVGERDGVVWLDLGPEAGAVALSPGAGEDALPPAFHRPSGTQPLEVPVEVQSDEESAAVLAELQALLGYEGHTWVCCLAWMMACLRPDAPYPVLALRGEEGSGKSTLARALRLLVDPRRPETLTVPKGNEALRNLAISAEHNHILFYDNLNTIDGDLSDAFCRLATGDGLAIRSLYSDRDQVTFEASRPVLFTSVTQVLLRPDLLDRTLLVTLPHRASRGDTPQLLAKVAALRPRVLGALVWACRRAFERLYQVEAPAVRMRTPAAWGEAAAPALGLPAGAVGEAYLASKREAVAIGAEDPMVEALLGYLPPGTKVSLTYRQLLAELTARAWGSERPPPWWPKDGKPLQAALARLRGTLRAFGVEWTVTEQGHDKTKFLHMVRKRPPPAG